MWCWSHKKNVASQETNLPKAKNYLSRTNVQDFLSLVTPRGFSLRGVMVFPCLKKTNTSKFQFNQTHRDSQTCSKQVSLEFLIKSFVGKQITF